MIKLITSQTKLTSAHATACIEDIYAYFDNKSEVSFDSETTGFDPHTGDFICVQLGDFNTQFVVDCTTVKVELLKDLLESGKTIIFQNAQFDLRFLLKHGIDVKNIYDTFLAELILTTGYNHKDRKGDYFVSTGLANISKKYTGVYLDKSIRGTIHKVGLTDDVIEYGAKDVKYLEKIKRKQLELIEEHELERVLKLENEVVRVFAMMAYNGVTLNTQRWLNVSKITEENVKELIKELDNIVLTTPSLHKFVPQGVQQNLFGYEERLLDINWSSPAQKLDIIKELGFNLDTVGFKELQKHKNMHILISKLIEFAKQEKLANSFGKAFLKYINKNTGRLHMSVWQILSTGRISVSDPI